VVTTKLETCSVTSRATIAAKTRACNSKTLPQNPLYLTWEEARDVNKISQVTAKMLQQKSKMWKEAVTPNTREKHPHKTTKELVTL